jgi:hypothetical protein
MKATARLVSEPTPGRYRIDIDKYLRRDGSEPQRIRIRRLLPAGTSLTEAAAMAAKLERQLIVKSAAVAETDGWDAYVGTLSAKPGAWLYVAHRNIVHRSKVRGFERTVSLQQLRELLLRSRGRCEVTGLRFTREKVEGATRHHYFHSFDRIKSSLGYTVENLRVVCHATNIAMNTWGEEVFAEMARGFVFNRYSAFYTGEPG